MFILSHKFFSQRSLQFLIVVISSFAFCSCSSDSVFEENVDLEDKTWLGSDSIQFSFRIEDQAKKYDVFYNIRNTITYPYQNLYMSYYLKNNEGDTLSEDLVNVILFDPKTGKPHGTGLGDIFSHQFKIIPHYQFPDTGVYSLQLKQSMRRDSLPNVMSVGITITEASPIEE